MMATYSFEMELRLQDGADFVGTANILYAAGCGDALFAETNGIPSLYFDRDAETLEDALCSAIRQAVSAGVDIVNIHIPPTETD